MSLFGFELARKQALVKRFPPPRIAHASRLTGVRPGAWGIASWAPA